MEFRPHGAVFLGNADDAFSLSGVLYRIFSGKRFDHVIILVVLVEFGLQSEIDCRIRTVEPDYKIL